MYSRLQLHVTQLLIKYPLGYTSLYLSSRLQILQDTELFMSKDEKIQY